MSLPIVLLVVAGLLAVVSVIQRFATRLTLPASILFAGLGLLVGSAAAALHAHHASGLLGEVAKAFIDVPVTSDTFMYVFVPALIFQSALMVDVTRMIEDAAPILLLAVVAVLIATAMIGLSLAPIAGVSLVACLLLASIVATTDTVAVIGIFRDVGAPARLCRLVEGESLLNDAAAIVTYTVLVASLSGGHAESVGAAVVEFLWTFAGGLAVGYIGARVVVAVLPWLQDLRLAQVTLTLALPYIVYIAADRGLAVSGVTAAVTAGLVMSAIAQPRIAPNDWRFLIDMWEQLAYWASSLIFVLAALLVPTLLTNVGWRDLGVLAVMIVSALTARALVLFGFFPILTRFNFIQRVGNRFNLVILWGGLRGAVTLALALAVKENDHISPDVQRFVAVNATGFVLFTLLVPGLTLRKLIKSLGLDRLSAFDEALRSQVLALSRGRVAGEIRKIGAKFQFRDEVVSTVAASYTTPAGVAAVTAPAGTLATATDDELLRLGLVALTQREREIVLEHFDARTISGRTVEELLADVGHLLDRARTRGHDEYLRVGQQLVGFSRSFRFAHVLHRRFGINGPIVDRLADRFERLLITRIVLEELEPYVDETLAPLMNERVTPRLHVLLDQRQQMTAAAIEALRAQYSAYAGVLEQRFLRRVGLRREAREYRALFDERVIGPELYNVLEREVHAARATVEVRPRLDLGLDIRALLARVPMFADLDVKHLDAVARLLRPQFTVPGERLISTGDPGDSMYFISSGVIEVLAPGHRILLTSGDFFGEMALLLNQPRQADVNALLYGHLLVLDQKDFQALVKGHPSIRARIDRAAAERAAMNNPQARSSGAGADLNAR